MAGTHDRLDEETRERLALYAIGALAPAERAEVEAHLALCRACRQEASEHDQVVAALAMAGPLAPPAAELKRRVFERLHAEARDSSVQTWKRWVPDVGAGAGAAAGEAGAEAGAGFTFVASSVEFESTAAPGVEVRRLFLDVERDRVTMLVRMRAGTSYPGHRHGGPEECYVLEGDLHTGDRHMRSGDYMMSHAGSEHPRQWTEGGCLLFIVSSLHDELHA